MHTNPQSTRTVALLQFCFFRPGLTLPCCFPLLVIKSCFVHKIFQFWEDICTPTCQLLNSELYFRQAKQETFRKTDSLCLDRTCWALTPLPSPPPVLASFTAGRHYEVGYLLVSLHACTKKHEWTDAPLPCDCGWLGVRCGDQPEYENAKDCNVQQQFPKKAVLLVLQASARKAVNYPCHGISNHSCSSIQLLSLHT